MLCWLGWHRWQYSDRYGRPAAQADGAVERRCARCRLRQYRPPPYTVSVSWLAFTRVAGVRRV